MIAAAIFLIIHWYISLFCQSFYLHRYISHKMFKLSRGWDRFFLALTIISQGPGFLRPNHYRDLHLRHHRHSDKDEDPHSPLYSRNVLEMMKKTYHKYLNIKQEGETFPRLVQFGDSSIVRISFILLYCSFYLSFTDSYWYLLLVPIHCLLGPIHGAIVNWCGHKYGYQNFKLGDNSRNTLPLDFLMLGELYQNNHHKFPQKINFAHKFYELDFTYVVALYLKKMRILRYE